MWATIIHTFYVQILHNEPFNQIRGAVDSVGSIFSDWVSEIVLRLHEGSAEKNVSNCDCQPQFCTIWKIKYLYSLLHHKLLKFLNF